MILCIDNKHDFVYRIHSSKNKNLFSNEVSKNFYSTIDFPCKVEVSCVFGTGKCILPNHLYVRENNFWVKNSS